MGVYYDPSRRRYTVRWTEDGRRRIGRFKQEADALDFANRIAQPDDHLAASEPSAADRVTKPRGDGIYRYETKDGPRWRFVFVQSDGTRSSRRGFASRSAAKAEERRIADEIRRRERVVTRDTFEEFWMRCSRNGGRICRRERSRTWRRTGESRLVPFFGDDHLSSIDDARVRAWVASMLTLVPLLPQRGSRATARASVAGRPVRAPGCRRSCRPG